MGKYFSDVVEQAIKDLYCCWDNGRAKDAAKTLFQASKSGDADAYYFLSRCFSGPRYSWEYHPFDENSAVASAMLRESVIRGSAVGILGALRMDMLTPDMRAGMPFDNLQQAWDEVHTKAEAGCAFCQYMIGNTYYFLDVIETGDWSVEEFENRDAWDNWQREQMQKCLPWYEKAFSGGIALAGRNYYQYYKFGRGDLISPDPSKSLEVMRRGAELGYPEWMHALASHFAYSEEKQDEALPWALKAAEAGHLWSWHIVGDIYWDGVAVERDLSYALECFEKTASYGNDPYACRQAAQMYFRGLGTAQDYTKAVQYLEMDPTENKRFDLLGLCYLLGWGGEQDMVRGRQLLERSEKTKYRDYALGIMYAEGLGVMEDIGKGVEYLKAAKEYPPARDALARYKKNLFGGWRRK